MKTKYWLGGLLLGSSAMSQLLAQPMSAFQAPFSVAPHVRSEVTRWHLGRDAWRYQSADNKRFTLGSHRPVFVSGLSTATLGGVSINATETTQTEQWRYGAAWGKVDNTVGDTQLDYGAGVGRVWLGMNMSSQWVLDGLYQRAEGYEQYGLGTSYQDEGLGAWDFTVTQSQQDDHKGWRYQGGYGVSLSDSLKIRWSHEAYTEAFVPVTKLHQQTNASARHSQALALDWQSGRLGQIGASYATQQQRHGDKDQRFGLSQQFWYSPNLRIDIDAQRERYSGDYNMKLRFSVPLF